MTRLIPPLWLLITILLMTGLDRWLPLAEVVPPGFRVIGWLPIVAGIAVVLWCARLFRKAATPIRPGEKPRSLVTHGPFAHSRNPIYVSMFAGLLGVALLLGSLSSFAGLPIFIAIIARGFVPMEEAALEQAFGEDFRAYCGRVRRWI